MRRPYNDDRRPNDDRRQLRDDHRQLRYDGRRPNDGNRRPYNNNIGRATRVDLPNASVDHRHYDDYDDNDEDGRLSRPRKPWRIAVGAGVLAVLLILMIAVAFPQQFKHQLAISFVRQTTPYTQLYFTKPGSLPVNLAVRKKNTFDITIENDEGRSYTYTYIVTLQDPKSHLIVSTSTLTVANMASVSRAVTVVPKDRKSKYLVTITLKGMNQSIHFYGQTS